MLNEYRCTRSVIYNEKGCPGHLDETSRQGHYIVAETETEAFKSMAILYPDDAGDMKVNDDRSVFTVAIWKTNV